MGTISPHKETLKDFSMRVNSFFVIFRGNPCKVFRTRDSPRTYVFLRAIIYACPDVSSVPRHLLLFGRGISAEEILSGHLHGGISVEVFTSWYYFHRDLSIEIFLSSLLPGICSKVPLIWRLVFHIFICIVHNQLS